MLKKIAEKMEKIAATMSPQNKAVSDATSKFDKIDQSYEDVKKNEKKMEDNRSANPNDWLADIKDVFTVK